jgi:hypothetical protein
MGQTQRQVTQVALEAVAYGTEGASYADLPIHIESFPEYDPELIDQPVYTASLGRTTSIVGAGIWTIPMKFYTKGSNAAGTAPELGKLFRGFGMKETISAGVSVIYTPVTPAQALESVSIKTNLDGLQYKALGAFGKSLTLTMEGGKPILAEMSFLGLYNAPTVVALPVPSYTDVAVVPPLCKSGVVTIYSQTHVIPKLVLKLENVMPPYIEDINSGNVGIKRIEILNREYSGTVTVEVDANNDDQWWTDLGASAERAVAMTGFGSAGNLIDIDFNKLQWTKIKPVNYKGKQAYEADFRINYDATTEFSLAFK